MLFAGKVRYLAKVLDLIKRVINSGLYDRECRQDRDETTRIEWRMDASGTGMAKGSWEVGIGLPFAARAVPGGTVRGKSKNNR